MGFLLYVVIWLRTALHTEEMTTQSAGTSTAWTAIRTRVPSQNLAKPKSNRLLSESKDTQFCLFFSCDFDSYLHGGMGTVKGKVEGFSL